MGGRILFWHLVIKLKSEFNIQDVPEKAGTNECVNIINQNVFHLSSRNYHYIVNRPTYF